MPQKKTYDNTNRGVLHRVDVDKKTIDFNGLSINQVDFKKLYKIMTRIMESMDELPPMGTSPLDCY
jgi:hypothetical protein